MIKIGSCDDHEIVRAGIISVLPMDIRCVLETAMLDAFLSGYKNAAPDVAVIDLNLPDAPGSAMITRIKEACPNAGMVVYSAHDTLGTIETCYAMGVGAFVSKRSKIAYLIEAIRHVNDSRTYFPPGLADRLVLHNLRGAAKNPRDILSVRELEVFLMVAQGKYQKTIAAELGIALRTVQNTATSIRDKLQEPQANWLAIALRYNLVSDIQIMGSDES